MISPLFTIVSACIKAFSIVYIRVYLNNNAARYIAAGVTTVGVAEREASIY